ncbi:hypothetical protein LINGRAHAP2_LOCUS36189 [Linum grandiflorum]
MMTMAMIVEPVAASHFAAGANIRCSAASSQSALRERRRKSKSKLGNGVLSDASSIYGSSPSPGSAEPRKKIATTDVPISVDDCEEDMFMASLICNVESDTDRLLVRKMDMECVKKLHFHTEVNYNVAASSRP